MLLLALGPVLAQEQVSQKATDEAVADEIERTETLKNTLAQDISTSNYYNLQAWLKGLNLSLSGNTDQLRKRLYDYYQVEPPPKTARNKDKLFITITKANQTRFFTLQRTEGEEESYIQISGGVEVNLDDSKTGEQHSIKADSIIFNRETSVISAVGNIIYERTNRDKKTEYYFGDSLTFKVKGWRGIIVQGVVVRGQKLNTSRPRDIVNISREEVKSELAKNVEVQEAAEDNLAKKEDKDVFLLGKTSSQKEVLFYLSGESLRKGTGEIMVLENGVVTTEEVVNPTFSLRASKIWLLSGDEWALINAPLFVGHIPVFYLPFYYYTSNTPFFHPVFGFREPYGNFVQTTTYFVGRRKDDTEDVLSFLPVTNSLKNYDLVYSGLFLVKEKTAQTNPTPGSDVLKLYLDYYSTIGSYAALEGNFKLQDWARSLKFFAGLGFYQAIDEEGNIAFLDPDGTSYAVYPVKSKLFGQELPFRYAGEFSFATKSQYLSLDLQLYSDPDFKKDYSGRKEVFDWVAYGFGKLNPLTFEEFRDKLTASSISTQTWKLSSKISPQVDFLSPYLSSVNLDNFVRFSFSSRTDSSIPEHDPTREFFSPKTISFPESNLSLKGTLFSTTLLQNKGSKSKKKAAEDDRIYSLLDDGEAEEENSGEEEDQNDEREPGLIDPASIFSFSGNKVEISTVQSSISYSFNTKNSFKSQAADEEWKKLSDVDNIFYWTLFSTDNTLTFNFNLGFFDRMIDFKLTNTTKANERQYFPFWQDAEKPSETKILDVSKQIQAENKSQFSTQLNPFKQISSLQDSNLNYLLDFYVYQWKYNNGRNEFETEWIDILNRQKVDKHQIATTLDFHPIDGQDLLLSDLQFKTSMTNILPPLYRKETIDPLFSITFFNWTNSWKLSIEKQYDDNPKTTPEEREWQVKPLTYTSSFKAWENKFNFSNTLIFDFKKDTPTSNNFQFTAWWFSGTFNMSYENRQEWDREELAWQAKDEVFIPKFVSLKFALQSDQLYFWKNRISLIFDYSLGWRQDLIRYNDISRLDNIFGVAFYVYDFLDLQFRLTSSNKHLYLYYPWTRESLGIEGDYNFFQDLFRSVNIFNEADREQALFKMDKLEFFLVHHLKNWDFILELVGSPLKVDQEERWDFKLGFYVKWIPVPLLQRRVVYEKKDEKWTTNMGR